ncbi:MAG: hypothetical protein IJW64_06520 [Clostridia bacterium]|nr:hypothetical protein [Clostridia bacterium]
MNYISYILPILFISIIINAWIKKVKIYDGFAKGALKGFQTVTSVLPYLAVVFIMTELFSVSGVSKAVISFLTPFFKFLGIPVEIAPLVILKPFSGSGSLAILTDLFSKFGVDSYISRCACAVFGSSETTFYVSAVYFSKVKEKRLTRPIIISLVSTFLSTVFACFICRFL